MSLGEFLTRMRVEVVKYRLGNGDEKLDQLAAEVGFCDASHLCRALRTVTGRRPGAFRRPRG